MTDDAVDSARADGDEPGDHDRAEKSPYGSGSMSLNGEQCDDDHHRDRHDPFLEARVHNLNAFDRGQHGNRRGDHAVAEEQRGAEYSERGQYQRGSVAVSDPHRRNSVMRAMMPPSPSLSARITRLT